MWAQLKTAIGFLGALAAGIGNQHLGLISAGVAFYGLLAIFPAITSVVTFWGFFADPVIVEQQLAAYEHIMPAAAFGILEGQVAAIVNAPKQTMGWASLLSILAALWATRVGVSALIGGLNAAHRVPPRGGLWGQVVSILLTFMLIGVALVALAVVVVTPVLLSLLPLGAFTDFTLRLLRWLIGAGVMLAGIGLLYRLGPNRPGLRSPLISPGSLLVVGLWALVSLGFSTYLENFGRYNEVYGSLGAVVALLMWFYFSAFVVLFGALVNAEIERLPLRTQAAASADTDTTPPAPVDEPPAPETAPMGDRDGTGEAARPERPAATA